MKNSFVLLSTMLALCSCAMDNQKISESANYIEFFDNKSSYKGLFHRFSFDRKMFYNELISLDTEKIENEKLTETYYELGIPQLFLNFSYFLDDKIEFSLNDLEYALLKHSLLMKKDRNINFFSIKNERISDLEKRYQKNFNDKRHIDWLLLGYLSIKDFTINKMTSDFISPYGRILSEIRQNKISNFKKESEIKKANKELIREKLNIEKNLKKILTSYYKQNTNLSPSESELTSVIDYLGDSYFKKITMSDYEWEMHSLPLRNLSLIERKLDFDNTIPTYRFEQPFFVRKNGEKVVVDKLENYKLDYFIFQTAGKSVIGLLGDAMSGFGIIEIELEKPFITSYRKDALHYNEIKKIDDYFVHPLYDDHVNILKYVLGIPKNASRNLLLTMGPFVVKVENELVGYSEPLLNTTNKTVIPKDNYITLVGKISGKFVSFYIVLINEKIGFIQSNDLPLDEKNKSLFENHLRTWIIPQFENYGIATIETVDYKKAHDGKLPFFSSNNGETLNLTSKLERYADMVNKKDECKYLDMTISELLDHSNMLIGNIVTSLPEMVIKGNGSL